MRPQFFSSLSSLFTTIENKFQVDSKEAWSQQKLQNLLFLEDNPEKKKQKKTYELLNKSWLLAGERLYINKNIASTPKKLRKLSFQH